PIRREARETKHTRASLNRLNQLGNLGAERDKSAEPDQFADRLPPWALARLTTGRFRNGAGVMSLVYSPDGKLLASGSFDETIRLWDAATRKELRKIERYGSGGVAFSPDGNILASGSRRDPTVCLWEVATGKEVRKIQMSQGSRPGQERAWAIAFSPDGKM